MGSITSPAMMNNMTAEVGLVGFFASWVGGHSLFRLDAVLQTDDAKISQRTHDGQ